MTTDEVREVREAAAKVSAKAHLFLPPGEPTGIPTPRRKDVWVVTIKDEDGFRVGGVYDSLDAAKAEYLTGAARENPYGVGDYHEWYQGGDVISIGPEKVRGRAG